jgi:hypothetical protein
MEQPRSALICGGWSRDLWAWMNAVVTILGLAGAVFSLSASLQWMGVKTVFGVDYG